MKAKSLILISILVLVTPALFADYGPQQYNGGGSPISLIFFMLIVTIIPVAIVCRRLAKEKGMNVSRYTVLGIIPIVNIFALYYMIGASNKYLDQKIDKILSFIEKKQG